MILRIYKALLNSYLNCEVKLDILIVKGSKKKFIYYLFKCLTLF